MSYQNRNDEVIKLIAFALLKKEDEQFTFDRNTFNTLLKSGSA